MNLHIYNDDPYVLPSYRMSPFTTAHVAINAQLPASQAFDSYADNRFGFGLWQYTRNGREGLDLALSHYNLKPNDSVTVLTSTGNQYLSSCVSKTIEKHACWNRNVQADTKLIVVVHEFGFPYPNMEALSRLGIPIIEDVCPAFFSQNTQGRIGMYGDFAVYSLSKILPMSLGGVLVQKPGLRFKGRSSMTILEREHIRRAAASQVSQFEQLIEKRLELYQYGLKRFKNLGFSPRLPLTPGVVPYNLLLQTPDWDQQSLQDLKAHLFRYGIQSSVFYGESAFFVPCHQSMSSADIDYIAGCVELFIKESKNNS